MKMLFARIATIVCALALLSGAVGVTATPAYANEANWTITANGVQFGVENWGSELEGQYLLSDDTGPARSLTFAGRLAGTVGDHGIDGLPSTLNATNHIPHPTQIQSGTVWTVYWVAYWNANTAGYSCSFDSGNQLFTGCNRVLFGSYNNDSLPVHPVNWKLKTTMTTHGRMIIPVSVDFTIIYSLDPVDISDLPGGLRYVDAKFFVGDREWDNGGNEAEWERNVSAAVADVNRVLAKSTDVRWVWDGQVEHSTNLPFNGSLTSCNYYAREDIKVWFGDTNSDFGGKSYGVDCDGYGTIVIDTNYIGGYVIPNIYDDVFANLHDYWFTVGTLVHEWEHTYGLNVVEGYSFSHWNDTSPLLPKLNINIDNALSTTIPDKWWNGMYGDEYTAHPDLLRDPMASFFPVTGAISSDPNVEILNYTISEMNSSLINAGTYRGSIHAISVAGVFMIDPTEISMLDDFNTFSVSQLNASGQPAANIRIEIWRIGVLNPYITGYIGQPSAVYVASGYTDSNGHVNLGFNQGTNCFPGKIESHYVICSLFVVKSFDSNNLQYGLPQMVDVYNLQLARMNGMTTTYNVELTRGQHITGNVGVADAAIVYDNGETMSDANGDYVVVVPDGWSGDVTPTKEGHVFSPASTTYADVTADQTDQDYETISISGHTNMPGATITYTGGSTVTDANGDYTFDVPSGWDGTVTPSSTNMTFSPAYRTFTDVTIDQTAKNFTAVLVIYAMGDNASGWAKESAQGSGVGGSTCTDTCYLVVGDTTSKQGQRSVVQFDTSYLPDNAIVGSVTMELDGYQTIGSTSGFGPSGNDSMGIYVADGCFGNCYLENGDYQEPAYSLVDYVTVLPDWPYGYQRWYWNSGTILTTIDKDGLTEFKLKFNKVTDNDTTADALKIYNAEQANPPILTIYFTLP